MDDSKEIALRQPTPYVSYATFSNALSSIVEHGVPSQIDRSVLKQFSGFNQNLIFQAFRFIGFTNDKDETTDVLHQYEEATPEARKNILADLLGKRYPEQVKVLANGTAQKLNDSFRDLSVEPSVKKKCVSFFLQMAKAAGLPISPHILRASRTRAPRADGPKRRVTKPSRAENSERPQSAQEGQTVPAGMVAVPIPVGIGPGKIWQITMEQTATPEDKKRFLQMASIALGAIP